MAGVFLCGEVSTPPLDFLVIGFSGKKNGGNGDKFKIGVFILAGCGIVRAIETSLFLEEGDCHGDEVASQ